MSRAMTRARRRSQRLTAGLREAVIRARAADGKAARAREATPGHGQLWRLLRDIEQAGLCVWNIAREIECTEDETAMIAQAVAPQLAGMTPGSVLARRREGEHRSQVSGLRGPN